MRMMTLNRKRIALILVGLVVAYFAVPFPFLSDSGRADVRNSAIRWLLRHDHSGLQERLKTAPIIAAGSVKRWSLGLIIYRGLYYQGSGFVEFDIFILRIPFGWVPVWKRIL